jgi:hypothetical protein
MVHISFAPLSIAFMFDALIECVWYFLAVSSVPGHSVVQMIELFLEYMTDHKFVAFKRDVFDGVIIKF